ncbi:cupin domain-containing protein [Cupriavidus sp. DL-D2]|uniref:JmjC domain-containing protein n=1 Tax=Cupriavidus sp. DL-D2 TaxID=3144974 RepID=UPI003212A738
MPINFSISSHDFRNNYQERKPFLMPGALPVDAVTWRDVNGIVERANVASDDFKISYDGIRPKGEYIESWWDIGTLRHRLIRSVVYDYMQKGATLISNKIYGEEKVSQISNEISNFTARQVVSSVYVAFGDRSSFKCHWDTRDVFAVQIIGRKRWLIYKPSFEFPLYTQQSKDYGHLYPCPDSPYMDVILEPGDILYLPRGWWHDPLPLGEPTVHIALGTVPAYTMDYLCWSVNQM